MISQPVPLSQLLQPVTGVLSIHFPGQSFDPAITGVVLDSRRVKPGNLFVALSGGTTDGHRFVPDALQRGAAAVAGTEPVAGLPVPYVQLEDARKGLAYLSAAYYGFPAQHLAVIGVTGTDGKTTTANLIYAMLRSGGLQAGMISTVNAVIGDRALDTGFHVTTPEAPDVQNYLAQMVAAGLTHVVLEATSHGLAQERVAACAFDMAVITNITHEHLDYHGSYEAYRAAKGRLFAELGEAPDKPANPPLAAVLNRDDRSYSYLAEITPVRQVTYGLNPGADVRAEAIREGEDGLHFEVVGEDPVLGKVRFPVFTHLQGRYNAANCLAAVALGWQVLDMDPEMIQAGIAALPGVPGRMERIDLGQEFTAVVDFAHTPNALRSALESARHMTNGQVIAVFGSAGLRDRLKRRMMAETSADLADLTVLTAEDPRTESLEGILAEMADGLLARGGVEGKTFWRVPDRGEALRFAIRLARPGDIVIACGKGHEQSMCFGETEYDWDDRVAMRAALAEHLGQPGPAMPYLPTQS